MKEKIKNYLKEFNIGTKTMFKEFFNKETNKKQRANMWTFCRIEIPILTLITSITAIITNLYPLFIASGIIAGFGGVTDFFDGKSARKNNSSSKYGKLLDQISDKFFAGIIGINLLFLNPMYILFLLGEAMIASVNVYYNKKYNMDINSNMIGKIKQFPLFATLALGYFSPLSSTLFMISNIAILTTLNFQLASAAKYLTDNKKEAKQINRNKIYNDIFNEINEEENSKVLKNDKSNNNLIINNSKELSIKDKYTKLRNGLIEISNMQNNENILEENQNQKTKK